MTASFIHETDPKSVARYNDGAGDVVILCAEEEVRDVIAYWLTSRLVRTFVAEDGYQANRILKEQPCRWFITDRVLPPWPGLDMFLGLRSEHPDLRIAFVANDNIHDGILARVTGASVLLQRPLTRRALVDALALTELQS
jgi:DNA-binding response OmpR family regulator